MNLSKNKVLLAALLLISSSILGFGEHGFVQGAPNENRNKSSNHNAGRGGKEGTPIRSSNNYNDESDRQQQQQRRLALSTAIQYPNPCLDLPADRVPELNTTNPANEGWTLALGPVEYGSSGRLPLPFNFTLSGRSYNVFTVFNKGYLAFYQDFVQYNLDVFRANVDTSGNGGGYVWRKSIGTNKVAVAWDNVGYYNQQTDKLNTFQVLISNGMDASMGLGNNVCYCYQDIQWTTNTLGIVGVVVGVGVEVLFGKFDQPGASYDGGYGKNDGFEYLDRKSFCFIASGTNFPPVAVNVPENNRVDLDCGEESSVTNLTLLFLAPEDNQNVSLTTSGASDGLTVDITQQTNNQATATINWTPTAAAIVEVVFIASDGLETTTVNLTFTYPGPCCQGTKAEIWNPNKNKFVQDLVNGSTYCLKKYNLRAVPCQMEPVLLKLWNPRTKITVKRRKDRLPPYFLWGATINATGSVDVKPNPKALPKGNYAFRIKAINATNANSSSYTEIRFKQLCPKKP